MKTIKIFLASSEELNDDREAFVNLIRKLNKSFEKRGIRIEVIDGDDYNDTQNEELRSSEIFLALFHKDANKSVIQEFDTAKEEFKKRSFPKAYVYCKDIKEGETESVELKEFKERLINELGHYWSRYGNRDTMQLNFVLQLEQMETTNREALKVKEGNVIFDDVIVAQMENLPFAALNEDFQKMHKRLAELPVKIEKQRLRADKYPDDEDLKDELQELLNEYNALKDSFAEYQNILFSTAKRITQLQSEQITERMRRAMDAFNEGDVRKANTILEEAERDGEIALKEYKQSKELLEQKREKVIKSINEILLKTDTIMADLSIEIKERIENVDKLYSQSIKMAKEIEYNQEEYANILYKYAGFLGTYAQYEKALEYYLKALEIDENVLGKEHPDTANSYNNIGAVYDNKGEYEKGLEYYLKALEIREKALGKEHPDTATSYINIGFVYSNKGEYEKALEHYLKALEILKNTLGEEHPHTATSYNNIGAVYDIKGEYEKALEYYLKALEIDENVLGKEHPNTATSYNNIGGTYNEIGEYEKGLEYHLKALEIRENVLGKEHPNTATSYNNIGLVYSNKGEYEKALEYYLKALEIDENVLGKEHPDTANSYNNIGGTYNEIGEYKKALAFHFKALNIRIKVFSQEAPETGHSYNHIGKVYNNLGEYNKALEYLSKALTIRENALGIEHPKTKETREMIEDVKGKLQTEKDQNRPSSKFSIWNIFKKKR